MSTGMFQVMDEAEVQGLDVMSTGVTLAWATEALQRGLISTKETDGLALAWGNYPAYLEAAGRIVSQPNDFYRALARGRRTRGLHLRRRGVRPDLRRQRDARLPHRARAATWAI